MLKAPKTDWLQTDFIKFPEAYALKANRCRKIYLLANNKSFKKLLMPTKFEKWQMQCEKVEIEL